jgi:hypothetical protein
MPPHQTPDRPPSVPDSAQASSRPSFAAASLGTRVADGFAFSSGLAAAIGGSLSLVSSAVLDAPNPGSWAFLAASGTFIIYNVDRLRDVARDRSTSPLRTAFVLRNRRRLYTAVGAMAIGFVAILQAAPASIVLLCLAIGLVGLLHRRLKDVEALKTAYVSLAWVGACVGLPWLAGGYKPAGPWVAGILAASLAANLVGSNLRDQEAGVEEKNAHSAMTPRLWIARAMAVFAVGISLVAPAPLHSLVWIPVCEGLALAYFRPSERYGHLAVDGGLLIGAFATWIHLRWAAGAGWAA